MENEKVISPVVIRTDNVTKELKRVSERNNVPLSTLEFNVLSVQTFSHFEGEGTNEEDWEELDSNALIELEKENSALLNEKFHIRQVAEIEIFSKVEESKFKDMESSVGGSHQLSKIFYTIKEGSKLNYFDRFKEEFSHLVYKKKLRAGILVGIFDSIETKSLQKLNAAVRVNSEVTFKKNTMFQIAQGIVPVDTKNDEIILHYEKKKENVDEHDRANYAKRGFLISAVKGELLIEYIKAKKGTPGRNCRGEYLAPKEPITKYEPQFYIDENIEKIESDDKIEYRAKISGYVNFDGGVYTINKDVEVGSISFKTTGSIDTELDADVSLNVKESDDLKDAIGENMEVEVNTLNVSGSVGSKAKIKGKVVSVNGQTHGSSEIIADDVKVNLHKGKIIGKNVTVTRLESGIIEADYVKVQQAIGGNIKAKVIEINVLGSHVTMQASERIEIEKTTGSENTFIINPIFGSGSIKTLKKNEGEIKEASISVRELEKEIFEVEKEVQSNQKAYSEVTKKLAHYKKNKVKMPSSFVKKYQAFHEVIEKLNKLKSELTVREERVETLEDIKNSLQGDIFNAKIINHDYWRGYNEIIFKLIDPEMNVTFNPKENSQELCYGLKQKELDDGEFDYVVVPIPYDVTEKPDEASENDDSESSESLFDDEEINLDDEEENKTDDK